MRVWTFQDPRQKKRLGEDAPWYVGWIDPDGRRKSKKAGSEAAAERMAGQIERDLREGTYRFDSRKKWADFREEWETRVMPGLAESTQCTAKASLDQFERIVEPMKVANLQTKHVDQFVAVRRSERGLKKGSKISPATICRELRHVKAVLAVAVEWRYLAEMPKFRMPRVYVKEPRYVTAEHFAVIFGACSGATRPVGAHFTAEEWWKAFLVTAYMTGWRVSELLALRWDNLDFELEQAVLVASETKGKRGERIPLHTVVLDHLATLKSFNRNVFHIDCDRRFLWAEFGVIQKAAGIHLPCHEDHEHTDSCFVYSFHDLRRAFATLNADRLTADLLQALMRHKSYQTTQRYIAMARQLNRGVENLHVPGCLQGPGEIRQKAN